MHVDWNFIFTAASTVGTLVAAIFSAVSARASMIAARTLTLPKVEFVDNVLRVPFACIRKDAQGCFIPGYGRLGVETMWYEKTKKEGGNILLVCEDITPSDSDVTNWCPTSFEPN